MPAISAYLAALANGDATGLFLKASARPAWKAGSLLVTNGDPLPGAKAFHEMLLDLTAQAGCLDRFHGSSDVTFALTEGGRRFRIHVWREEGGHALHAAPLESRPPTLEEAGLGAAFSEALRPERGLIVLAGPPRSGRTTTLAALLADVNENHARHIVSIERAPGFVIEPRRSLVEQILVGTDAPSVAAAASGALSAGADVLGIDAVADEDSLRAAVEAAEAGALVYAVTDGYDLADALDRLADLAPAHDAGMMRSRMAAQIRLAACQHLVRRKDGRCAVAAEALPGTPALNAALRELRFTDIAGLLDDRRTTGVRSLEASLA